MDPLSLVGLIAAGAQNIMSSAGGFLSSAMQYQQNKKLQDRAFQHQIRMYRNAHQWEVEDLRKAGLNPILSTHSASGASPAPTASVSAPDFNLGNPLDSLVKMQGFSSARDLQRFNRENHKIDMVIKKSQSLFHASQAKLQKALADFENDPDVIALKKRQMKYNSSGRLGKEIGVVDEVTHLPASAFDLKSKEKREYKNKQFLNTFPKELIKNYKKSFPFLGF